MSVKCKKCLLHKIPMTEFVWPQVSEYISFICDLMWCHSIFGQYVCHYFRKKCHYTFEVFVLQRILLYAILISVKPTGLFSRRNQRLFSMTSFFQTLDAHTLTQKDRIKYFFFKIKIFEVYCHAKFVTENFIGH